MKYILAHDSGTGGNKAVIYDENGQVAASVFEEYKSIHPRPNWAQQRIQDWWNVFRSTTRKVIEKSKINPKDILVIGIRGQQRAAPPNETKTAPGYLRLRVIGRDRR